MPLRALGLSAFHGWVDQGSKAQKGASPAELPAARENGTAGEDTKLQSPRFRRTPHCTYADLQKRSWTGVRMHYGVARV